MAQAAVFTMKLESDLRAEFMAEAEASHRPASQVVRELMRQFVEKHRAEPDRTAFLHKKRSTWRDSPFGMDAHDPTTLSRPSSPRVAPGLPTTREDTLDGEAERDRTEIF